MKKPHLWLALGIVVAGLVLICSACTQPNDTPPLLEPHDGSAITTIPEPSSKPTMSDPLTREQIVHSLLPHTPRPLPVEDLDPGPLHEYKPTQAEEAMAKKLYEEGYVLLIKKRDQAGAARKYRELLDKYGHTRYMNTPLPPGNKTRIEYMRRQLIAIGR